MNSLHVFVIAGPSCSGKSEISEALAQKLRGSVLQLDHYYRDRAKLTPQERTRVNFDVPEALDHDLLIDHLQDLKQGHSVERPSYDFETHTRRTRGELFTATRVLIVEGLFALYWPELRRLATVKIFVDAPDLVCFRRRCVRDVEQRGRTLSSVIAQFNDTVRPMAKQYIRPTSKYADLILCGEQPLQRSVENCLKYADSRLADESACERARDSLQPRCATS